VVLASSGKQALEMIKNDVCTNLVLMDMDLGKGMDGQATALEIQKPRHLPIVFLTSHAEREMVEKVRNITRCGYVLKSAGESVLISSIEMAFEFFETNQMLREGEARHSSIFHLSPAAMAISSRRDGVMREVNETWLKATGYSRDIRDGHPCRSDRHSAETIDNADQVLPA